jgi:hypothetical protein
LVSAKDAFSVVAEKYKLSYEKTVIGDSTDLTKLYDIKKDTKLESNKIIEAKTI